MNRWFALERHARAGGHPEVSDAWVPAYVGTTLAGLLVHLVAALLLSACASSSPSNTSPTAPTTTEAVRSKLVGVWQFVEHGVTIEVTYTPTTVSMAGVPPTPYVLNGNEITVDIVGPKTSLIEFRGNDEMTQTNKTDGQRYVFKRKRGA